MNCKEVINLVDPYLDGELDPVTSQKVEAHLRECSRCDQSLGRLSACRCNWCGCSILQVAGKFARTNSILFAR